MVTQAEGQFARNVDREPADHLVAAIEAHALGG